MFRTAIERTYHRKHPDATEEEIATEVVKLSERNISDRVHYPVGRMTLQSDFLVALRLRQYLQQGEAIATENEAMGLRYIASFIARSVRRAVHIETDKVSLIEEKRAVGPLLEGMLSAV